MKHNPTDYLLRTGLSFFEPIDIDKARRVWAVVGREFVANWIADKPGSRPWAWWEFDAPEPRQRLDSDEDEVAPAWGRMSFGQPMWHPSGRYETELEYLDRLDLLTEAEREALEATPCQ